MARASIVEQEIVDWLVEHIPANLLREAAAALLAEGGVEEIEVGNEYGI